MDEDDDFLHDAGKPAPRVGRAFYIQETSEFRTGGGRGWAWSGLFNALVVVGLAMGIIGVFAGVRPCSRSRPSCSHSLFQSTR